MKPFCLSIFFSKIELSFFLTAAFLFSVSQLLQQFLQGLENLCLRKLLSSGHSDYEAVFKSLALMAFSQTMDRKPEFHCVLEMCNELANYLEIKRTYGFISIESLM